MVAMVAAVAVMVAVVAVEEYRYMHLGGICTRINIL
jgi:hypothetical protein